MFFGIHGLERLFCTRKTWKPSSSVRCQGDALPSKAKRCQGKWSVVSFYFEKRQNTRHTLRFKSLQNVFISVTFLALSFGKIWIWRRCLATHYDLKLLPWQHILICQSHGVKINHEPRRVGLIFCDVSLPLATEVRVRVCVCVLVPLRGVTFLAPPGLRSCESACVFLQTREQILERGRECRLQPERERRRGREGRLGTWVQTWGVSLDVSVHVNVNVSQRKYEKCLRITSCVLFSFCYSSFGLLGWITQLSSYFTPEQITSLLQTQHTSFKKVQREVYRFCCLTTMPWTK